MDISHLEDNAEKETDLFHARLSSIYKVGQ